MLLDRGADPHLPDMMGKSPSDQARESGRLEILDFIKRQQQQLQLKSI